jgi:hypothetical protein
MTKANASSSNSVLFHIHPVRNKGYAFKNGQYVRTYSLKEVQKYFPAQQILVFHYKCEINMYQIKCLRKKVGVEELSYLSRISPSLLRMHLFTASRIINLKKKVGASKR